MIMRYRYCLLSLLVLCWLPLAAARAGSDAVLTLDVPAGEGMPRRFRTCFFPFAGSPSQGLSRKGLDRLAVSGSAQFSHAGLTALLAGLPGRVTLVDLRRESHGFLGGAAVSWRAPDNQGNPGLAALAVEAAQARDLAGVDGEPRVAVAVEAKLAVRLGQGARPGTVVMGPSPAQSEAAAAAAGGAGYLRLAVADHHRPDDAVVDRFVRWHRSVAPGTWLHFHCRGGAGRTTTFLAMVDMLRNAGEVSFEGILERQWRIGGTRLDAFADKQGERRSAARARLDFLRRFYDYARANPGGRPQSWGPWLAGQSP